MTPSITEKQINTAIGDFITAILGIPAVVGQVNRVASLKGNYAVMWYLNKPKLGTNVHTANDAKFTAAITGLAMTVSAVQIGTVIPGRKLFGVGVADGTLIGTQVSGETGGPGVYGVTVAQTIASGTLSGGGLDIEQSTEIIMQVDVHGDNSTDNATTLQALFWDETAVDALAPSGITPLYADDPRQAPFITAAAQYEDRWTVDLHMQVKPVITVPQQFADAVALTVTDVDVAFPDQ